MEYYLVNKAKPLLKFEYSERATKILPIFHLKCGLLRISELYESEVNVGGHLATSLKVSRVPSKVNRK